MLSDNKIELLWSELLQIDNIDKRKEIIYHDTFKSKPIYSVLAEQNPFRLFEIIGGDFSDVEKKTKQLYILILIILMNMTLNMILMKRLNGMMKQKVLNMQMKLVNGK